MAQKLKFGNGTWATKEGSTLAYNSENNNFKPLPFNFERDSIATRVNKEGLIEVVGKDIPRIDYTDSSEGVLLLEKAATNLFPYSNKFDTDWNLNNITTTNEQIGVGGSSDAWKITASSGSGEKKLNKNILVSGNHAISVYAKKGTRDYVYLRGVTNGGSKRTFFNLNKGIIETDEAISSQMISMGNGWYRCEIVVNQQAGFEFYIGIAKDDNTASYTDDGTGNIYVQYAQAESGNIASSYIPTNGSAVPRAAETCNGAGNEQVFNDSEGVLYYNGALLNVTDNDKRISISDGSSLENRILLRYLDDNELQVELGYTNGFSELLNLSSTSDYNKIAVVYNSINASVFINGFNFVTNTMNALNGLSQLQFQRYAATSKEFVGKTKEIGYYDTALTDAELEYMTSYRSLNELVTELNLNEL